MQSSDARGCADEWPQPRSAARTLWEFCDLPRRCQGGAGLSRADKATLHRLMSSSTPHAAGDADFSRDFARSMNGWNQCRAPSCCGVLS